MGYSILIVDDSVLIRSGLQAMFEKSDRWERVETAENGQLGIQQMQEMAPDIVCLDIQMPVMDGLEVLREVQRLKQRGQVPRALPVVVLSGTMHENDDNVRKAKMLGAADALAKPEGKSSTLTIKFKELEERLLRLLE
ncbi:MAG: response regulator transcription factor [Spirochaetota bacterium]